MVKHRSFPSLFNLQSTSINFNFGHLSAKYQGYSLTFWLKIAHFHHFSLCNQHQSISILIICRQHTKVIALLFGQTSLIFITFILQSTSINFKFCHLLATYQGYSLTLRPKSLIFITFQSGNKINQFQVWSFVATIPRL